MNKRLMITYLIIVFIVMTVLAYFFVGVRGIMGLLGLLKTWIIWGIILGLVFYGVWYFFIRKERDDRVHMNAKRVIEQSLAYKTPFLRDLYLSGDKFHPQIRLGKILGFSKIANVKGDEEDVFVFKRGGFPLSVFEEAKAIRVAPHLHTDLLGDVVIQGISLVKFGGFYFINSDYLDYQKIDHTILVEIKRTMLFEMLKDWKIVIDQALGIAPEHQKTLEKKDLLKIPARTPPPQEQGG